MSALYSEKCTVGAVVITYHPDIDFSTRIRRIAHQVSNIVIVDNGSLPAERAMLHEIASALDIRLILNEENLGIATALNQGMDWAISKGYDWVLTLDQDTIVDDDMMSCIWRTYSELEPKASIGMIASSFRDRYGKHSQSKGEAGKFWTERPVVITSGSFVSVKAFREAGKFRDDYFIDKVDTEYCLRLRSHGYRIYASVRPHMTQFMGNLTKEKFLWRKVNVYNYSPLRRYYMTRNRIILARTYMLREIGVMAFEFRMMLLEIVWIVLYEENKKKKLGAILTGVWHGITGRMGKL